MHVAKSPTYLPALANPIGCQAHSNPRTHHSTNTSSAGLLGRRPSLRPSRLISSLINISQSRWLEGTHHASLNPSPSGGPALIGRRDTLPLPSFQPWTPSACTSPCASPSCRRHYCGRRRDSRRRRCFCGHCTLLRELLDVPPAWRWSCCTCVRCRDAVSHVHRSPCGMRCL